MFMDIKTASIFVEDQSRALAFYTDILGFRKVNDIDLGELNNLFIHLLFSNTSK